MLLNVEYQIRLGLNQPQCPKCRGRITGRASDIENFLKAIAQCWNIIIVVILAFLASEKTKTFASEKEIFLFEIFFSLRLFYYFVFLFFLDFFVEIF